MCAHTHAMWVLQILQAHQCSDFKRTRKNRLQQSNLVIMKTSVENQYSNFSLQHRLQTMDQNAQMLQLPIRYTFKHKHTFTCINMFAYRHSHIGSSTYMQIHREVDHFTRKV